MPRLSPLTIERMQPKATRQEVPDSVTSGLYFIVQPSGVKSWAVRYRFDRKPCKLTLGRYPAVELGVARDRAKAALEEVDKGNNPALRKRATRLPLSGAAARLMPKLPISKRKTLRGRVQLATCGRATSKCT